MTDETRELTDAPMPGEDFASWVASLSDEQRSRVTPAEIAARVTRENYTEHGPKDANPCRECGMSDWWCLYDINRGAGRCCPSCGISDVHGVTVPAT